MVERDLAKVEVAGSSPVIRFVQRRQHDLLSSVFLSRGIFYVDFTEFAVAREYNNSEITTIQNGE